MDRNSKEFKKLQEKWYGKLKRSGFEDIERSDESLKKWSLMFVTDDSTEITREAKTEYYRAAGHFLHDHQFDSTTEKRIWELHSSGLSIRNIVKMLTKENKWFLRGRKPNKRRVHETVQDLVKKMLAKIEAENAYYE